MESDPNYKPDESEESENEEEDATKVEKKKYKCNFSGCNAAFFRPSRLQQHLNHHKDERPYTCTFEECSKSYTNPSHLKRHLQTHKAVAKTYKCQHCSANISTLSNLKRHYNRAHNTERELFCQECKVSFRKKNRYEEHMASHKNSSLYKCDKCGKLFLTHIKFKKHELVHISKNYKCPVENCSEIFEKWAIMIKHKKTEHAIEYPCRKCDKVFTIRSHLKIHSKIHSNDRPAIPCPYDNCNRLYYFKRNLKHHIHTTHLGNKFHCDICDLKLSTKQKIEEHIVKIHQMEKKPRNRKAPQPRKDIGLAKKSVLSQLTGIQLSVNAELQLMKRNPTALLRDKAIEENSSFSEDDRGSDVSAKGA